MIARLVFFVLLLSTLSVVAQTIAAPDYIYQRHPAPAIGYAGFEYVLAPCSAQNYEAIYPGGPPSTTMLEFRLIPCPYDTPQKGSYKLTAPIHIQAISFWIGTSANSRFESVQNLQFWTPDGVHMMWDFFCEYDKHQDVVGMHECNWTFPQLVDLPTGTIVQYYRYPGGLIFCGRDSWFLDGPSPAGTLLGGDNGPNVATNWHQCETEVEWRVYGTGK